MLILTARLPSFVHHRSAISVVHTETHESTSLAGPEWNAPAPDLSLYDETDQNQLRSGFRRHRKTGQFYYALQLCYWQGEGGPELGMLYRALYQPPDGLRYRYRPLHTSNGAGWMDTVELDKVKGLYRFEWI